MSNLGSFRVMNLIEKHLKRKSMPSKRFPCNFAPKF